MPIFFIGPGARLLVLPQLGPPTTQKSTAETNHPPDLKEKTKTASDKWPFHEKKGRGTRPATIYYSQPARVAF